MAEPTKQPPPTSTLKKHRFQPGGGESRHGDVKYCDVANCGLPMSHRVHHPIEKGVDEVLPQGVPRLMRDDMLMGVAELLRGRSTCLRGQVGVVIAMNGRIVATGYNGAPPGMPHCTEVGCDELTLYEAAGVEGPRILGEKHELGCQRAIHAEANAIAWAARAGVAVSGGTMYSTHSPCRTCAGLIISSGIGSFYYTRSYRVERLDLLAEGKVKVVKVEIA